MESSVNVAKKAIEKVHRRRGEGGEADSEQSEACSGQEMIHQSDAFEPAGHNNVRENTDNTDENWTHSIHKKVNHTLRIMKKKSKWEMYKYLYTVCVCMYIQYNRPQGGGDALF